MSTIHPCPLPEGSLLSRYRLHGAYTDCYSTEVASRLRLAEFVAAFYTTRLFKVERQILRWTVSRPSTDADAARLAQGEVDAFAAWSVEDRSGDQLLLCDLHGRTRSWLMVAPSESGNGTRLYFGSAVVPARKETAPEHADIGAGFRLLLGFHKLYSKALLKAAVANLHERKPDLA
ncbi:MAG: hypothetical protein ABWY34_01830 [Pseudoxanthomonas sp.]